MTKELVQDKYKVLSEEEALSLHESIVSGATNLKHQLLLMYSHENYKRVGYDSWGEYLDEVAERANLGTKALRRLHKASLLIDGANLDLDSMKEGTVRPIIDTLSDRKGFSPYDRERALTLAIELAGGDEENVTGNTAQTAAWFIAVNDTCPDEGLVLVERMRNGEVTPQTAYKLVHLMNRGDGDGMEHILAELSDVDLGYFLVDLRKNGKEAWEDIKETVETTGYMPVREGQVKVSEVSYPAVVDYLNEPYRMKRYEKAVERSSALKEVAKLAARVVTSYWGIHPAPPESLNGLHAERELYEMLIKLGFIRYGAKNDS